MGTSESLYFCFYALCLELRSTFLLFCLYWRLRAVRIGRTPQEDQGHSYMMSVSVLFIFHRFLRCERVSSASRCSQFVLFAWPTDCLFYLILQILIRIFNSYQYV